MHPAYTVYLGLQARAMELRDSVYSAVDGMLSPGYQVYIYGGFFLHAP